MGVSALELRRRVLMAQPHKERKTGGIVSFSTHVPQVLDVSVPLSPVQAGTGDPYPPGGGINLINVADGTITLNNRYYVDVPTNFQLTAGETYTLSIDVTSTLEPFTVSVGCGANSYSRDIASQHNNNNGHITLTFTPTEAQLEGRPYLFIRAPRYMTAQTATAEVKNYQLEKGATAHDFAPYSNIRPISGHTGAAVWRTGKNLLPTAETVRNGRTTYVGGANYWIFLKAGTYTMSEKGNLAYLYWRKEGTNNNNIIHTANSHHGSFTLTEDMKVRFWYYAGSDEATYSDIMLEPAAGVLTVDMVLFAFKDLVALNGASARWVYNSAYNIFETQNAIIPTGTANTETGIICSCYQSRPYGYNGSYSSENSIVWAHTSGTLRIKDNRYTDVDVWKTAIADEQIAVPLAEPLIVPLTPAEIRALMGENNVFADTGDVDVEFWTN